MYPQRAWHGKLGKSQKYNNKVVMTANLQWSKW